MSPRDPDVERLRRELEATSPTYQVCEVLRAASAPMTAAQVAAAAGLTARKADATLRRQQDTGRATRDRLGRWRWVDGSAMPVTPSRPDASTPRTYTSARAALPAADSHGRRVLMLAGGGDRREDCTHYEACLAIAAGVTSGYAHCPAACPHYQRRDSRVGESDMVVNRDPMAEYTV